MLHRFGRMSNELIQVGDSEGATVTTVRSSAKYTLQVKEINVVTVELQRRGPIWR